MIMIKQMNFVKNVLNHFYLNRNWLRKRLRKGINFIFDPVDLLYYICLKINLNSGGSYINSLDWIKTKKAAINPENNDGKCFNMLQYLHLLIKKLKSIQKGYKRLNFLKINIIGKEEVIHQERMLGGFWYCHLWKFNSN